MRKESVKITEVGPRDGLQNEPTTVSTETKLTLIDKLVEAGLKHIEATSFVSPKWVPQMADHADVMRGIHHRPDVSFPVLIPNLQGLDHALEIGVEEIAIFAAASESFTLKNTNASIKENLARYKDVIAKAKQYKLRIRGYVSCAIACPYEGKMSPNIVTKIASELYQMGCYEISLGDTTGMGTPKTSSELIQAVRGEIPIGDLAVHNHDTYGQALANIYVALELGIRSFDASVAGLGGCPYAKGASGNVASEDLLYMLDGCGFDSGVNLEKLLDASRYICTALDIRPRSKVALALPQKE